MPGQTGKKSEQCYGPDKLHKSTLALLSAV